MDKDYILHKYLNGEATADEIMSLKASPEYKDYLKIADASAGFEAPEFDASENYKAILQQKTKRLPATNNASFKRFLKIAAVFMVLAAGYLFISSLETSVNTQIAEKKSFTLPDNSLVELNSNSAITFKKRDWDKERTLALKGEAYFKVTKGSKFQVETTNGVVSVLGTQFNVYSRDSVFNVKCFEGLVSVSFNDTLIKLPAGNRLSILNDKLIMHSETTATQPEWILDESSFENASLATVLAELQRQYPIKVSAPDSLSNRKFSGSFTHNNLQTALQSICDPLRLGYTVNGNVVTVYAK